jgi:hypothetical protein
MTRLFRAVAGKAGIVTLAGASVVLLTTVWAQPRPSRVQQPRPIYPDEPAEDFQPRRPRPVPDLGDPSNSQPAFRTYTPIDEPGLRPVEMDEFASEVSQLLDAYRQAKDDKNRAQVRSRILAALTKKFDSQHQRREREITALKARLKELSELHEKRGAERKGIIERHADYLLRNIDGLGWESDFQEVGPMTTVPTY